MQAGWILAIMSLLALVLGQDQPTRYKKSEPTAGWELRAGKTDLEGYLMWSCGYGSNMGKGGIGVR